MTINSRDVSKCAADVEIFSPKMVIEPSIGNLQCLRPSRNSETNAAPFYPMVIRAIVLLLGSCRPTAIGRRIVAICIQAVDAMFRRGTAAHVVQEMSIGLQPSLADGDTSAAVVLPISIARIQTSGFNANPDSIFRFVPFARLTIFTCCWSIRFQRTAARFHHAVTKCYASDNLLSSAIAAAQIHTARLWQRAIDDSQMREDATELDRNHGAHTVSDYIIGSFFDWQFLAALAPNGIVEGSS